MFRSANGDGAALSWQACQSHPRPPVGRDQAPVVSKNASKECVRTQTPSIGQTAPSVVIQTPSFPSGLPPPRGIGDCPRIMHDKR